MFPIDSDNKLDRRLAGHDRKIILAFSLTVAALTSIIFGTNYLYDKTN